MSRIAPHVTALLFVLLASAASAQTGDAVRGGDLWSDTPGTSGIQMITASCSNCHTVDQRRSQISGGGPFADISFDTAMTRFTQALNNQSAMATFQQLQLQDVYDLAAYIADTPKTTAANLDFTASAVNAATAAQTVDLRHSVAPLGGAALSVTGATIAGAGAATFTIASNSCSGMNLAANNTCRVGITFNSPDTAGKTATLTLSLRQGTTNFSRSVALSGAVAGSTGGGGGGGNSGDSGGGAFGLGWLAALATAALALAAASRRGPGRTRRAHLGAAHAAPGPNDMLLNCRVVSVSATSVGSRSMLEAP